MTLQLLIVPAIIAAILWFFVKPDKPLIVSEEHVNKYYFSNTCNDIRIIACVYSFIMWYRAWKR